MTEMIIPVITALAPYVLDSLFGERYNNRPQHIPKHVWNVVDVERDVPNKFSPPSIKDMTMYGYGYRYPRARRKTIELEYPAEFAKAAIFNKGVAANNNWVQYLKFNGYYDKIRAILQEASQGYRQSGLAKQYPPEKAEQLKQARIRKLMAQAQALAKYKDQLKSQYPAEYNEGLTYDEALYEIAYKLDNEFEKLNNTRPFGTNKAAVPQRRKPKWYHQMVESKPQSLPPHIP